MSNDTYVEINISTDNETNINNNYVETREICIDESFLVCVIGISIGVCCITFLGIAIITTMYL